MRQNCFRPDPVSVPTCLTACHHHAQLILCCAQQVVGLCIPQGDLVGQELKARLSQGSSSQPTVPEGEGYNFGQDDVTGTEALVHFYLHRREQAMPHSARVLSVGGQGPHKQKLRMTGVEQLLAVAH